MKLDEVGVGKITKQNTTADVKPGETMRQAKKLGLVNGKPKLLHKTAAKNSDPNTLFNLGLAEGYSKDVDEKWVKDTITHFAKKYGISPKIALAVWRSEGGMNWQSKLKPKNKKIKTDGGQEASYGPFQLYTGKGGLGQAWEKLTGKKLSSSTSKKDIASQIDFALQTVPKRGWQDFKGANRVGINQYDGVPTKNNPMYKNLPIPKPTDVKSKDMYKPSNLLNPMPVLKAIDKKTNIGKDAKAVWQQTKKEMPNISVDKDSFTYKNIVKPVSKGIDKATDYISKGFTGFMKDLKKSPEYKAAGEKNKKLYGPKNTVKETELVTELVTGAIGEHLINRVNKVADICATMGNKPLLYRQVRNTRGMYGDKALIIKATPRGIRDEKLLGSGDRQNHVLNKLGIEHAVFATMDPHPGTQGKFGANYFMVPIGEYKVYSSQQVKDLGSDTSYSIGPAFLHVVNMDPIIDTYKEGWPSAGFPNEVILDCEQYYLINVGEFVLKYAGKKARQMYSKDDTVMKIKNDINKELLTSRFKTYNDMAWYLRNPVTNLLKVTIKKESVKELKIQKPDPKDTLGKKRKDMPQIKKQDYEEFMDYLKSNGAKFSKETVPASELKAMQSEFSDVGVIKQLEKNIDQGINSKAVIISNDDFVLDGHHRWLVAMNTGNDLDVYRVNIPAYELFDLVTGFEKTYYKGMYETPGTITVPMKSGLSVSIFPHRPLKIKKSTKGKLNYNESISQVDLDTIEVFADRLFSKVGIDVEFTRHFLDRVNDKRNGQPISVAELTRLFKQEYKRYGKPIAQMGPDQEAVMKDLQTNLNLPFALQYDKENNELDLVAKTIMRKDDFKTPNKVFAVEAFNNPYPIDWGGSDDPESERWVGNSILADGSKLTLEIASFDPGEFQIDFYRKDKSNVDTMKATGQGDEFRVFATVQKGILEWWESIDQDEVHRIEFSASKESDDSKNRDKLYARFAKQWANKIGWVATTGQVDDAVHFVLMRPNAAKFAKDQDLEVMEDLRDWFKQKWVNIGKKKKGGGYADCGTSGDKKGYAKCVPAKKAASMTKKEKESAVRRKRAAQNKKGRGGKKKAGSGKKPIRVKTKSDAINTGNPVFEAWSQKYKKSIDCSNPKGFSQKAHCAGRKKKNEEAPPGREKQVRKLKKKFDDPGAPYAIAWAQHNKHGKPKKESVNEDKVYDILLDNIGAGPFDGGCVVVAQALQKIHGGELMALVRNDGIADHAVVQVGETMYDYDGPGTVKEVVERFEKNEGARINSVRKLRMTDLPDAPRSNELAKQIASEMKPVKEEKIKEGVNDPHIFKAVFMAGGPGSGKSFVAKNILGGTGLRPVNSDEVYEFLLKRQGLTLDPDSIASTQGQEIRGTAKGLTSKRQDNYIEGRLGLVIDGTGKEVSIIQELAQKLKSIGYSVSMIFVNTSLDVAQKRNKERDRVLPSDMVADSWNEVQQNLMKYQQIFGADRFHIVDNSGGLEDLDRTKNFDKVYNEVQRFINTPPKHKKALEWIQNQKAQNNARQTNSGKPDGGVANPN